METINKIQKALKDYGVGYDDVHIFNRVILIPISWGDWKHDHACCDYVMKTLGYPLVQTQVTEEDGSDCYSADH